MISETRQLQIAQRVTFLVSTILVNIVMISLFESIIGISLVALLEYWTGEDIGFLLLRTLTFLLYEVVVGGVGRL